MGKAAMRRKAYQKRIFVELSHKNPELFEAQWAMRLESWLTEASIRSQQWSDGEKTDGLVFEILDNAMAILEGCDQLAAAKVKRRTYDELSRECSAAVARVIDGRLCYLSNTNDWPKYGKKNKRAQEEKL